MKFHTSLPVKDIKKTKEFYSLLFDTKASKVKEEYVKFTPATIDLNISFIKSQAIHEDLHLGFEARDSSDLNAIYQRLKKAGLIESSDKEREDSTCCYARQDKFWVMDPSGYEWEIYTVLENSEEFASEGNTCCAPKENDQASSCGPESSDSCC